MIIIVSLSTTIDWLSIRSLVLIFSLLCNHPLLCNGIVGRDTREPMSLRSFCHGTAVHWTHYSNVCNTNPSRLGYVLNQTKYIALSHRSMQSMLYFYITFSLPFHWFSIFQSWNVKSVDCWSKHNQKNERRNKTASKVQCLKSIF